VLDLRPGEDPLTARAERAAPRPRPPLRVLVRACVAVAALSLLGPHELTYDPTAWLIWGREIVDGQLETRYGPSWKPLPMLFTTPFALLGDDAAALLWLVVARAGGLMAVVLAYRLAARVAGPVAGAIAATGLLLADAFVSYAMRGNSEGLLAAVTLGAVDRHVERRPGQAFALAVVAALLRPEVWPIVGLYGLWLVLERRRARGAVPWPTVAAVAGSGVAILALWMVPEYIGSGNLLRAASRARLPVEGMPGDAAFPFLAVFTNAVPVIWWPLYAGGVFAVALAWRDRRRDPQARLLIGLAVMATSVMVLVALLSQTVGFTGNARYLTVPIAIVCILGAIGLVRGFRLARERSPAGRARALLAVAVAVGAPFAVANVLRLGDSWSDLRREARDYGALEDLFARAGGEAAVRRCGLVFTRGFHTQAVAWELGVHESGVSLRPEPPGSIVALHGSELLADDRFPERVSNSEWTLASSCRLGG
jgi:hypothetical protein